MKTNADGGAIRSAPRVSVRVGLVAAVLAVVTGCRPPAPLSLEEATIAEVHAAMAAGSMTATRLVEAYLDRVEAFDRRGRASKP